MIVTLHRNCVLCAFGNTMTTVHHTTSRPVGATLTTVLSMALVLLLAGLMGAMGVVTSRLVAQVQECASVNLSIANSVMPTQLDSLNTAIGGMPEVARTHMVSRSEALQQWKDETGEDLMELLGENPLNASIEVGVKAQWASSDSLLAVKQRLEQLPGVVDATTSMRDVDNIMDNARSLLTAMAIAVVVMLVIAVALITSMVKLLTYSQRFHIHTMTLVGARTWFIVKPYMWRGAIMGLGAAIMAAGTLTAVWEMMLHSHDSLTHAMVQCLQWRDIATVAALMAATGTLVGGTAAALAARRYTRVTHDELFG